MKKSEAMRNYKWAISKAVEYRFKDGSLDNMYWYYRGAASAYGEALEYGFERVDTDIETAIAETRTSKAV